MRPGEFNKQVWLTLKLIPRGRVTTYKELARYLGKPAAARAVGSACHRNPNAPRVPCHRVVKSDGRLGGYAGGLRRKISLLKSEGIKVKDGKVEDWPRKIYKFK